MAVEEETASCTLIAGEFAYFLQLFIGLAALSSLLVKRWKEVPKRPLQVWVFDTSKQAIGALFIHFWNVLLSIVMVDAKRSRGSESVDECALYFVQFVLDVVIGTIILWALIRVQEVVAIRRGIVALQVSGDYGTPPSFALYRCQLLFYLLNLAIVKTIITVITVAMDEELSEVSDFLFEPVQRLPKLELIIVMVICPWFLNALQFWIIDNVIRKDAPSGEKYANLQEDAEGRGSRGGGGLGGRQVGASGAVILPGSPSVLDGAYDYDDTDYDGDEEVKEQHGGTRLTPPMWVLGRSNSGRRRSRSGYGGGVGGKGGGESGGVGGRGRGARIAGDSRAKGTYTVSLTDGSGCEVREINGSTSNGTGSGGTAAGSSSSGGGGYMSRRSYEEHFVVNGGAIV